MITKLLIFIFKTTLIKLAMFLLLLVDVIEKYEFYNTKYSSISKSENEIVKILIIYQNLEIYLTLKILLKFKMLVSQKNLTY